MGKKYYTLGNSENSLFVKIMRILFGAVCIGVAIFWLNINLKALIADRTLWVTIIFLSGFGFYQIWAGFGRATRFIEMGPDYIRLKKNALFSPVEMRAFEIERIELFPLNLIFFLKAKKRLLLRFGTTYYETNEKVKDEILKFAEVNNIPVELVKENI